MDLGKCVEAVCRVPGEPVQAYVCVCACTCACRREHCERLGWSGRYGGAERTPMPLGNRSGRGAGGLGVKGSGAKSPLSPSPLLLIAL